MAYKGFAHVYDQLMAHAPYDKWVAFTEHMITQSNKKISTILDLGCGTGEIAIRLAKQGYTITGVDYASDMLTHAMAKSTQEQVPISWIQQDIIHLHGFSNIDLCISYCDVMNYITNKNDIENVCQRVYDSLKADGLFIFDIHHIKYANEQLIDHTFAEKSDDLAYIWECEQGDERGEMYHYLTFFQRQHNHYIRFDEVHHQRTYEMEEYELILKKCGFTKINFHADFNAEKGNSLDHAERIFILAQK